MRGVLPKEENAPRNKYGLVFQLWQKSLLYQYLFRLAKKLVLISATSLLVTKARKKRYMSLKWMPCFYYPLHFQKDIVGVRALIDSGVEINAMTLAYALKLGLKVYSTNIGA